jgi:hypothetical protein
MNKCIGNAMLNLRERNYRGHTKARPCRNHYDTEFQNEKDQVTSVKKQGKIRRRAIVSSQGEGKSVKVLDDGQGIMIVPR